MARGARFISVGARLAVGTTLLVGLASAGAYAGLSHVARDVLVAGKLESGQAVFRLFCQLITAPIIFDDQAGISEALGYLEQNDDVLYGRLLDQPHEGQEPRLLGEYRRPGFDEEVAPSLAPAQRVAERRVELVENIRDKSGAVVGRATLILSLEKELTAFEVRRSQLLLASAMLAFALIVLLVSMLRARVVNPLKRLTHAAERLALGEQLRLELPESDEVGKLAGAFDRMAETIRKREQSLASANDALTALTLTDPLTGLKNRRFLDEVIGPLTAGVTRRYRQRSPDAVTMDDIVFVMLDLDHFKSVNDTHGHDAGDRVLVQMGDILHKVCRDSDIVVRWGGEEFLIVARNTVREHGCQIAERVRGAVRSHGFEIGDGNVLRKTCSVGYASFPLLPEAPGAVSWQDVIRVADRCLYAAKHGGRDRSIGVARAPKVATANLVEDFDRLIADGELQVTVCCADAESS